MTQLSTAHNPAATANTRFRITLAWMLIITGSLLLVAVIEMAIARYHLWDLGLILRRTTQHVLLTGILTLIYFSSVVVLQRVSGPLTGDWTPAVVLSTLLIAALFPPLRRRMQQTIDHRLFLRKLLGVIQETTQPEHDSFWLRPATRKVYLDEL